MDAAITLYARDLVKVFHTRQGEVRAVDGLSLEVRRGETVGLIGPDGAGKTTTVRVILGLLQRTAGESGILGHDSMADPFAIREVTGYIAQQFALPPDLTVRENMRFFADIHGVPLHEQRKRIPRLLEFAGLLDFQSRLAGRLSGGMKKKLALACSLIHRPRVLILDEPTLGVDPVSRREFWHLLNDLRAAEGVSILVCTPYMDEAERCQRVALIAEGRLIAYDRPDLIRRQVPGELLECRPSDFRRAKQLVAGLPGVLEVQTYGPSLHLFVDAAERRMPEIEAALRAAGIPCQGMRQIIPQMEEAFISLLRRRREAERG